MNPFLFSIVALCLATTGAIAQYGSAPTGYQGQRKMSPSPQTYAAPSMMSQAYGGEQYGNEMSSYEQQAPAQNSYQAPQQQSYKAPSSAQTSTYDERTPAASSYGKQQQSYGTAAPRQQYQQQQQQSYAAPAATGYGKQAAKYEEQYHAPMPFAWGYDINDGYGGAQYHKETGDEYGKRTGSYGYTDAYGIYRQVDYVADEHGFRATIKTNEPGTSNESPADVQMQAYEPPSNYYAGNTNNYGQQQQNSGYQSQAGYGKSNGYASAPAAQSSYGQQQRSSSYGKQQQSYQAAPARQMYHQQQEQQSYSSSAIAPTYSKGVAAAPAKRY